MARMGFIQDEMDLKLLVLYIMARIAAPITFLQLLELALCDAGVDYFSLTQAVEHLENRSNYYCVRLLLARPAYHLFSTAHKVADIAHGLGAFGVAN